MYRVTVDHVQGRQALLSSTVRAAKDSGLNCVIVSADPETLSNVLLARGLRPNRQSLLLLQLLPDTQKNLQRTGCERLLLELEDAGVLPGSLLIVEAADDFFSWCNAAQLKDQLRHYRRWLKSWRVCGLFLSTPTAGKLSNDIVRMRESFSGVAEFRRDLGGYRWLVQYWFSSLGALEASQYGVRLSDGGATLAVVDEEPDGGSDDVASLVYYTAGSLAEDEAVADNWLCCQDYEDVVAVGTRLARATVVLDYRQLSSFPLLAQAVHRLRYLAGRQVRIIIRERGGQLRYSQELLLNRLGANQIVYLEFGISRLLRAVEAMAGQRFTGFIEADFDQALAAAMPSEECGYLPAGRFCEVVKSSLQKTEAIDMHHALVRLDILPAVAHVDVLLNCQPRRANDVVTADGSHLYVFLYACREADVESALGRIIIEPLEQLFSGQSYWSDRRGMLDVLDELHERYKLTGMADFSLLLPANNRARVAADTHNNADLPPPAKRPLPNTTIVLAAEAGEGVVAAPRTVVRHPLRLRSPS